MMFQPQTVGIIGSQGNMAQKTFIPFFRKLGCRVIGSDLKNPDGLTNQEVAEQADVLILLILPIKSVANFVKQLIPHVRPRSVLFHGTSVAEPARSWLSEVLLDRELVRKEVTTGFLHLLFGQEYLSEDSRRSSGF